MSTNAAAVSILDTDESEDPKSDVDASASRGAMTRINADNTDWRERYRPSCLDDLIVPPRVRQQLVNFIDGRNNALLIDGPPGTGKGSMIKAIIGTNGFEVVVHDCCDGQGMAFVNDQLPAMASTMAWSGKRRLIVLDEVDQWHPLTIAALRGGKLEAYTCNCSFIMTCNDRSVINAAVQDRPSLIDIRAYSDVENADVRSQYIDRVNWIVQQEGVQFKTGVVEVVVEMLFPSLRQILAELSTNVGNGIDANTIREYLLRRQTDNVVPKRRKKKKSDANQLPPLTLEMAKLDLPTTDWDDPEATCEIPELPSPPIDGLVSSDNDPEAHELAALLDDLIELITRHLSLPEGAPEAIALFIVLTYVHGAAKYSPILLLTAATKGSGKTTALGLIARLCHDPIAAARYTDAAIYHEADGGATLLFDQGDQVFAKRGAKSDIINGGFTPDAAKVITAKDTYQIWCPKVIAMNGKPEAAMLSRSIVIDMQPPLPEDIISECPDHDWVGYDDLRVRLGAVADSMVEAFRKTKPAVPQSLLYRDADRWKPLLGIAEFAGATWTARAQEASLKLSPPTTTDMLLVLLKDIKSVFGSERKMHTKDIIDALIQIPTSPWSHRFTGTPAQRGTTLARMLSDLHTVKSDSFKVNGTGGWGYHAADFEDAWKRYRIT